MQFGHLHTTQVYSTNPQEHIFLTSILAISQGRRWHALLHCTSIINTSDVKQRFQLDACSVALPGLSLKLQRLIVAACGLLCSKATWLRENPLRGSAECWSGAKRAEESRSGPDFNGIEWGLVVYRRPLGLAASEALATQHYRRRFESRHRSFFDCHCTSVSEFESACTLPRCNGMFFRNGRADECCRLFMFWLEHEMHFNASLLVSTPEESEIFYTTQRTLAHDTLQQVSCYLCAGCRRRRRVLCSMSHTCLINASHAL